jgi:hypothetical protein
MDCVYTDNAGAIVGEAPWIERVPTTQELLSAKRQNLYQPIRIRQLMEGVA